jgi:hypothetical protein
MHAKNDPAKELSDFRLQFRMQSVAGRQFVVMADEVAAFKPAVSVHADGFKMVDYGMLGIIS